MTTRLYSHTDVGAPARTGTALGQMLTVLRACLVTGYGTRTPAGWTNPYLDLPNNVGVFQGQSGTGDLFRINDNVNYEHIEIQGFATMSDVNTGTEVYPSSGNWIQGHRDSTSTTYDPWYVIANEEFCYVIGYGSGSYPSCFFFGQYDKIHADSPVPNYCMSGDTSTFVSSTTVRNGIFINTSLRQRRNHWNDIYRPTQLALDYLTIDFVQPNPLDGRFYFQKIKIRDKNNPPYVLWGHLPDCLNMYDGGSGEVFNRLNDRLTIEGQTYFIVDYTGTVIWAFRYDLDVG